MINIKYRFSSSLLVQEILDSSPYRPSRQQASLCKHYVHFCGVHYLKFKLKETIFYITSGFLGSKATAFVSTIVFLFVFIRVCLYVEIFTHMLSPDVFT